MSIYLSPDDSAGEQVASNQGWTDFGDWLETIDEEEYPDLIHLWEHGWSEPVLEVVRQLKEAATSMAPDDETVRQTIGMMLGAMASMDNGGPVIATNGLGQGGAGELPATFRSE